MLIPLFMGRHLQADAHANHEFWKPICQAQNTLVVASFSSPFPANKVLCKTQAAEVLAQLLRFGKEECLDQQTSDHTKLGESMSTPGLSGGLNGSTQHFLEVYSQESENLKFVVGVDLSAALLC
jgi:hypothetical protein